MPEKEFIYGTFLFEPKLTKERMTIDTHTTTTSVVNKTIYVVPSLCSVEQQTTPQEETLSEKV